MITEPDELDDHIQGKHRKNQGVRITKIKLIKKQVTGMMIDTVPQKDFTEAGWENTGKQATEDVSSPSKLSNQSGSFNSQE